MSTPKVNFTKVAIGGMENPTGTAVALTHRLPINELCYLEETVQKSDTGIITGRMSPSGVSLDSIEYGANPNCPLLGDHATRIMMESLYGNKESVVQTAGGIGIHYKGSADSCLIEVTSSDITAKVGKFGAETADSSFAVTISGKTVKQIADAINALTDYEAYLLAGDGTASATSAIIVGDGKFQAKDHQAVVFFGGSSTGAYLHVFKPNYTADENSTFTMQFEGAGDNVKAFGGAVNSLNVAAELKGKVSASWGLLFLGIEKHQDACGLLQLAEDLEPLKFNGGQTFIAGKKYSQIKSISMDFANNIAEDEGWSQGGVTKDAHYRGAFVPTGSITLTTTTESEVEFDKVASDDESSLQFLFAGRKFGTFRDTAIFDFPKVQYTNGSKSAGTATVDTQLDWSAVDCEGYGDYAVLYMVTDFQ